MRREVRPRPAVPLLPEVLHVRHLRPTLHPTCQPHGSVQAIAFFLTENFFFFAIDEKKKILQ